jgi:hypothetical protein
MPEQKPQPSSQPSQKPHEYDDPSLDNRSFLELVRRDESVPLDVRIHVAKFITQFLGDTYWQKVTTFYHIQGFGKSKPSYLEVVAEKQRQAEEQQR